MPTFVFDAYGTLFDVHAAIGRHRAGAGPDADRISELWRSKQLEYTWTYTLAGTYTDFWSLTERALDYALARFPTVDKGLRSKFLDAYKTLDAYPDAREALEGLKKRGAKTAILSNGSPAMLASAVKSAQLGSYLDAVLSVDSVRVYKPRSDVYRLVTQGMSATSRDVIFASSNRWDVMGARAFGFRTIWVNRGNLPEEYHAHPPERVVPDLRSLIGLT